MGFSRHSGRVLIAALALAIPFAGAATADAGVFGTAPLNISTTPSGGAADGPSGNPSVSGDNRKVKFVAFDSLATNLVSGDTNGVADVFVWSRPGGSAGNRLNRLGSGKLQRASVSSGEAQGNGASSNPALDGSMTSAPRCVAFQSTATNLDPADATPDSDIFVRNLRTGTTQLVSSTTTSDATNPSIDGRCKQVMFEADGKVMLASSTGGRVSSLGAGRQPRFSRDSLSKVYVNGSGRVVFRHSGRNRTFGKGANPVVSDQAGSGSGWAIAYQAGRNAKLALVRKNGNTKVSTLKRGVTVGGISVFAAERGIVVYAKRKALYYLNRNSGNSDDLAYSKAPITEIDVSARINIVAFAAPGGRGFRDIRGNTTKSIYVKYLPQ